MSHFWTHFEHLYNLYGSLLQPVIFILHPAGFFWQSKNVKATKWNKDKEEKSEEHGEEEE